jgi:hypothetical protein
MLLGCMVLALACVQSVFAESTPWWLLDPEDPVLDGLGDLSVASAVAVASGGAGVAAAYPEGKDGRDSILMLRGSDGNAVEQLRIPGEVRSMVFADGGTTLLAVVAKRSKRRPPETYLASIELDSLRPRRLVSLPHTATDVDFWPDNGSIVFTAQNELRTFRYPELSSGPLYRILGRNLAFAHLGGSQFVVSNERGLLIVDLSDRPGEEEMPARARLDPGATVVEIAVLETAPRIAARREGDNPPIRIELPPLSPPTSPELEAARSGKQRATPDDAASGPDATETSESSTADASPTDTEAGTDGGTATKTEPVVAEIHPAAEADPHSTSETEATRPIEVPDGLDASIVGRVADVAADVEVLVLAQGPDNLLREASRVPVQPDGTFVFVGLAPGSYRLVLDAGGRRLIESDPPFQIVRVEDVDSPVTAEPFHILRIR